MKHTIWLFLLATLLLACSSPSLTHVPATTLSETRNIPATTTPSSTVILTGSQPKAPLPNLPPTITPTPSAVPTVTPTSTPRWTTYKVDLQHPSHLTSLGTMMPTYDLTLTLLEFEKGMLEGQAHIRYVNSADKPLHDVLLRLYPNTPGYGGTLKLQHLSINGIFIKPRLEMEGTAARLPLPQTLPPGQIAHIVIEYQLIVPYANHAGYGALNREGKVMTLGGFYPTLAVQHADSWHADLVTGVGDYLHARTAFFAVTVTVPSDITVVTSGRSVEQEISSDGITVNHFTGGPIRDFTLVIGQGYTVTAKTTNAVQVRFFSYTAEGHALAPQILRYAVNALQTYEHLFGAYPYTELDLIQSPISASGLESPGAIQLGSRALSQGDQWLELVVAHEVAHQWWYGIVGNDQVNDAWLDEGLASYSSILYFREVYGAELAKVLMAYYYKQPYETQSASYQQTPANLPVTDYNSNNYGPIVYIHATNFFYTLHQTLGEEKFLELLQNFLSRYRYRIASGEDFIAMAKRFDAIQVEKLYEHWILGKPHR